MTGMKPRNEPEQETGWWSPGTGWGEGNKEERERRNTQPLIRGVPSSEVTCEEPRGHSVAV